MDSSRFWGCGRTSELSCTSEVHVYSSQNFPGLYAVQLTFHIRLLCSVQSVKWTAKYMYLLLVYAALAALINVLYDQQPKQCFLLATTVHVIHADGYFA